ncbi:hypothetical protein HMPREF3293_01898 [Christensenella minuta]|uniref:Uncharacterized protein n=1 Tax=Christensenella minuta TaxID=626937 RepID=A0A136Q3N1_9FIRM|nr:hypothetical protein HMPREF3293_01898 [Christensenella minuta]
MQLFLQSFPERSGIFLAGHPYHTQHGVKIHNIFTLIKIDI